MGQTFQRRVSLHGCRGLWHVLLVSLGQEPDPHGVEPAYSQG